jgi:4'-phosphopantetheinyl transferase EntD
MGIALSISHKEPAAASHHVAVALARTRASGETVGVDVEAQVPISARVAARILTEHERRCIDGEGADAVGLQALAYFSLKEAFYKAVHPWLLRHVGFQEVEVDRGDDASTFRFVAGTPVCDAVGGHYEDGEWLVATALVRTCQAA